MDLIDIAAFDFPNDADILESILLAENIPYFLGRRSNSYCFPGSGGILSVGENDRERVVQIIKDSGFGRFLID
jgi:hypothetical protein